MYIYFAQCLVTINKTAHKNSTEHTYVLKLQYGRGFEVF